MSAPPATCGPASAWAVNNSTGTPVRIAVAGGATTVVPANSTRTLECGVGDGVVVEFPDLDNLRVRTRKATQTYRVGNHQVQIQPGAMLISDVNTALELSTGAIVGIVVAIVVLIAAAALAGVYGSKRHTLGELPPVSDVL